MNHFCREASQLQSDEFDRELTLMERFRLRMHLLICAACRNYSDNLELLNNLFHGLRKQTGKDESITLPDSDRERISEALKKTPPSGS
jgi:predicted anti-sigma-YlaC factor YlaD